jgi:hypothetical protein
MTHVESKSDGKAGCDQKAHQDVKTTWEALSTGHHGGILATASLRLGTNEYTLLSGGRKPSCQAFQLN